MPQSIADIRLNYSLKSFSEKDANTNPISQFDIWWKEAVDSKIGEVNAMTLATASVDGTPSARIVLLKGFSEDGFVFFTNYNSFKGRQLTENPKACLVFFWRELERQVRITGLVSRVPDEESTSYFNSRPEGSRIGAIVSPQSEVIESREWLDKQYERIQQQLKDTEIQRPGYWGGFIVKPVIMEFWQGRPSRLHDRIQYTLQENGDWFMERLAP
jgi:pyridoxamine 5'-phosphate oxidase